MALFTLAWESALAKQASVPCPRKSARCQIDFFGCPLDQVVFEKVRCGRQGLAVWFCFQKILSQAGVGIITVCAGRRLLLCNLASCCHHAKGEAR